VVVFATDRTGRVQSRTQSVASNGSNGIGSWSNWATIDGAFTQITAVYDPDKRIELFGIDAAGKLFHRWELATGTGSWSAWAAQDRP